MEAPSKCGGVDEAHTTQLTVRCGRKASWLKAENVETACVWRQGGMCAEMEQGEGIRQKKRMAKP